MRQTGVKEGREQKKEQEFWLDILARYFLLTMALSFIGWGFETLLMLLMTGKLHDQGFMTLPFCPIYGCSLMVTYLLLGTPDEGKGLLKKLKIDGKTRVQIEDAKALRYVVYFLFAFLIPSIAELFVGWFFDQFFDTRLWSYRHLPFNLGGYVCLSISLCWAVLIFLFMKFLFMPIKRVFFRLPKTAARVAALGLLIATIADFAINFIKI